MLLPFHDILVNRRRKRVLYLCRSSRELDHATPSRYLADLKPMRLQPRDCDLNILIHRAEVLAEFVRREPLVVVRRAFVLLLIEQLPERPFLFGAALQHQQHAVQRQIGRRSSAIVLWTREGVSVSLQDQAPAFVYGFSDFRHHRVIAYRVGSAELETQSRHGETRDREPEQGPVHHFPPKGRSILPQPELLDWKNCRTA